MRKKSTLAKKLASYSAFASVILIGKSSDAQIIYTDLDPDVTTSLGSSYLLDLNNDGINDFTFNVQTSNAGNQVRVIGASNNAITRDIINHTGVWQGYAYADTILNGSPIGPSASFYNQEILATHYSFNDFGNFWNVTDHFMGVKIVVSSNTYYGWIRLSVPSTCDKLVINDYAVDTIANEIILAGDKCGDYAAYANTAISISGELTFCEGGNVGMITDSVQNGTYQWLVNGTPIEDATAPSYTAEIAGSYSVIVTTSYGCVDTSSTILVEVFPLPAAPVITQSDNTLMSTVADSYQWYMNGVAITGATSQMFDPVQGGDYTVIITDANGCSSESEPFSFIPIGISDPGNNSAIILQSDNQVHIQLNDEKFSGGGIKIFNAIGENVFVGMLNKDNLHLDLNHYEAGIYFLTLDKNGSSLTKKIAIQ